jgi:nitrite reductase/ring-hydroxylating ferredoxin subunit
MAQHRLGRLEDFADGTAVARDVGGTAVVVWRSGDEVCVVRNRCPHLGLSLTTGPGGVHVDNGQITCPWHSSRFDLCSGTNLDWVVGVAGRGIPGWSRRMVAMGRKPSPLTTYPVSRDGDILLVDL